MASLSKKIELYAKENGVNTIDFLSDVKLQNLGLTLDEVKDAFNI